VKVSPFKMKSITRKSKRATIRHGSGSMSELVTVAEPVIPRGPWLLGIPMYGLGLLLRQFWIPDTNEQVMFSVVFLLAGVAVGTFSWFYAKSRTRFQRWHATLSPPAFTLILIVPLCFGFGRYSSLFVATYWVVLSSAWVARVARSVWGDGADLHNAENGGAIADALGLSGVRVSRVNAHGTPGARPDRITSRWTMRGVEGFDEILKVRDGIRNMAKAVHVRLRRVPTDPQAADVTVVLKDMLAKPVAYPGPSAATSIADPLIIGIRQDGTPEELYLTTEHGTFRGIVAGCSGSGKSRGLWAVLAEGAGRTDAVWWIADIAKAGQTVAPASRMFDWIATDEVGTKAMLEAAERIGQARSRVLGDDQSWHPGCGMPLLVVWVEEAAGVTSSKSFGKQITRLSERVRSVGIVLVLSLQRPSGKNMPTDARAQFTGSLCFGLDDEQSPKMVLSAGTLEGGARPEILADTTPGVHWLEGPGIPRADWSEQCRTYLVQPGQLRRIVEQTVETRASLDTESVSAAGRDYLARHDEPVPARDITPPVPIQRASAALSPTDQIEIARGMVEDISTGPIGTGTLLMMWRERTEGMDRRAMYRALDAVEGISRGSERGLWVVNHARPDEQSA
jgi:hypothetical protein